MKVCGSCKEELPLEAFHKSSKRGTQAWCRDCRRAYDRAYFAKNWEKRRQQERDRRNALTELMREIKARTPCADRGRYYPPVCLQFDHLPGHEKVGPLSEFAGQGWGRQRRLDEIAKCEVVCANCHSLRTAYRRGT